MLVFGILYLNQFRQGLIDAKIEALKTQSQIISNTISTSATSSKRTNLFLLDPNIDNGLGFDQRIIQYRNYTINKKLLEDIIIKLITSCKKPSPPFFSIINWDSLEAIGFASIGAKDVLKWFKQAISDSSLPKYIQSSFLRMYFSCNFLTSESLSFELNIESVMLSLLNKSFEWGIVSLDMKKNKLFEFV